MRRSGTWFSFSISLIMLLSMSLRYPSKNRNIPTSTLNPTQIYIPVIVDNYKPPPIATISHYVTLPIEQLNYSYFYSLGQAMGESVESGFWGYVILAFGKAHKIVNDPTYYIEIHSSNENIPIQDIA